MKNIYEILADAGIEIPEDKKEAFDKAVIENYRTKSDYDNAVGQRDKYKQDVEEMQKTLDGFKDVDVDDLKNQIATLTADIKKKDDEYAAKEADRVFTESLSEKIKERGGRNIKAIMGLLDIDALKTSKNQDADIKSQLDGIQKSDSYMFGSNEPISNPVGGLGSGGTSADAMNAAMRAAAGLPPETK